MAILTTALLTMAGLRAAERAPRHLRGGGDGGRDAAAAPSRRRGGGGAAAGARTRGQAGRRDAGLTGARALCTYLQERVLAALEAAVSEASVAATSTSAAAEALSRKVLQAQEQSGAVEAAVRRAEADRLSLAERQHGAGVAQVVDTDSESDGESDDDEEEDCGGDGGNGGSGGSVGVGGGLGDVVAADDAGDDDPTGVGDGTGGSGRGGGRKRGGDALATGAGPGEQAALESRVEEIQLEVRLLSRKKQDLEQVHGSLQQLRRKLRAQGGATGLVTRLAGLQVGNGTRTRAYYKYKYLPSCSGRRGRCYVVITPAAEGGDHPEVHRQPARGHRGHDGARAAGRLESKLYVTRVRKQGGKWLPTPAAHSPTRPPARVLQADLSAFTSVREELLLGPPEPYAPRP
eukprot:scaffold713_cov60-Phaeocystis_antarctica.AAC.2